VRAVKRGDIGGRGRTRKGAPEPAGSAGRRPSRRRAGEGALKVAAPAARTLRAGHPWVFRDSLLRPLEGLAPGACVQIADEDGAPLGWGLVEPEGAIALRVVSTREQFAWTPEAIEARVQTAIAFRERALGEQVRNACRLIHAEADGLPGLAVDRLGDHLLIYKYSRAAESYLDTLVAILERTLDSGGGVYMQDRLRPVVADDKRPPAFHLAGRPASPDVRVEEDGLVFLVDVTAPVSPGLFLDLREGRRWCERLAAGKRVLNLFSFTGAFALRAVRAGATTVVNVDSAARSHARCRQNLTASGLPPEACTAVVGDVFAQLERLRRRGETFDLVVVDPPPFSRVGGKVFSALQHWFDLVRAIAPVVAQGGHVLAVSNASRLAEEELMAAIGEGARAGDRDLLLVGETGLPADFPVPPAFIEGRYLKIRLLWAR
jgi:23S rRNA (cytosine1962-C5)-methyltransferase